MEIDIIVLKIVQTDISKNLVIRNQIAWFNLGIV